MSANAGTWFYTTPETDPFMVTERLNGTFWQARIVEVYWRCTQADPASSFQAQGLAGEQKLELEWVPSRWLALRVPQDFAPSEALVEAISKRVLMLPLTVTYQDIRGFNCYEWHSAQETQRWSDLQGRPDLVKPRRVAPAR